MLWPANGCLIAFLGDFPGKTRGIAPSLLTSKYPEHPAEWQPCKPSGLSLTAQLQDCSEAESLLYRDRWALCDFSILHGVIPGQWSISPRERMLRLSFLQAILKQGHSDCPKKLNYWGSTMDIRFFKNQEKAIARLGNINAWVLLIFEFFLSYQAEVACFPFTGRNFQFSSGSTSKLLSASSSDFPLRLLHCSWLQSNWLFDPGAFK